MQKNLPGEFGFIDGIRSKFSHLARPGMEGIGDDCAVIPIGGDRSLLVTADMLLEDVHFMRRAISPFELGRKSLSVNLSDIAAMGGHPAASFLSLAFPRDLDGLWREDFISGYKSVSEEFSVPLLGGDTNSSENGIAINVTVVGEVRNSMIKRRSGARPGDRICVAGNLGDSGAGLGILLAGGPRSAAERHLVNTHHNPRAQVGEGEWLAGHAGVHSMMDISDGLASDLAHILEASGCGARVDMDLIPVSDGLRSVCGDRGWDPARIAATGGEDYVLLFTAESGSLPGIKEGFLGEFGFALSEIGEITEGGGISWFSAGKRLTGEYKGFTHF